MGGDVYDIIRLVSGRYGVLIADVSGKGIDAAVHTAMVKYLARGLLMSDTDPVSVITKLNQAACQELPPEMFITLFLGVLDSTRKELTYVNAGHDQPIHYVRHNRTCSFYESTGRALGVIESSEYSVGRAKLSSGDVLVLYTDGVTDARRGGEFLGLEGLERLIVRNAAAPPDELVRRIFASITRFARNQLQDDAAMLVIKAL